MLIRLRPGFPFVVAVAALAFFGLAPAASAQTPTLESGWTNPPTSARLRAYWWWLNGNVTKAAITRDLEEMKAKGFGGALICDAGGAEQDGNDRVPHGPTFFSPEWRELYKHTLREADRLGLEMSLNILSGWNLGGPMVTADDAAKKLVWSEARLTGPGKVSRALPAPKARDGYYHDFAVVAYRLKSGDPGPCTGLTGSSEQPEHPAALAGDDDRETYWVSNSSDPGKGPSRASPQWLQLNFSRPVTAEKLLLEGRAGYGPKDVELQASDDGRTFRTLKSFAAPETGSVSCDFSPTSGRAFRLVFSSAYDPRSPKAPRNVQVAEFKLFGKDGSWPQSAGATKPLKNWEEKAIHKALHFSAPDTAPLFEEWPETPGEEDARTSEVLDLTSKMDAKGVLSWEAPAGTWQVLRFGYTIGDHSHVSTCSDGWKGYALDVLDSGAFQRYWDAVVEPLIADAGPLAGKTLKYLHTDSWEVEPLNWTPKFREQFLRRRGYDMLPYLPALAGRVVNSRSISDRFLHDFRKTIGDLTIDEHYRIFRDNAHKHHLQIHPESGGPHAVPIDAQRCLGWNDAPMSEFWAWSWKHRIGDTNRFFVKQPASAAHTYGHNLVLAEGFTTIGPHWQETIWDNLKPSFDKALCEGLNLLVWHAFVCSPAEMGIPGQQYFAGTHFNPNTTWWNKSEAFLQYIDRSQFLLQQGLFAADVCYYYGDHVPNFTQVKTINPAGVLPGFDYDVITEEALLTRASARDGRLALTDGMSYRLLMLPNRAEISLPVLRKLKQLVGDGVIVVGPRPTRTSGLTDYPRADAEVAALANELWGGGSEKTASGQGTQHAFGKGRVVSGTNARQFLLDSGVAPDFECSGGSAEAAIDYIHRTDGGAEIYFVANRLPRTENLRCIFRVAGKAPELWDPVTGERRFAAAYSEQAGRTTVPLDFSPCGSWFVVFRDGAPRHPATATSNSPQLWPLHDLPGAWTVKFDPKWGGPESAVFENLVSWTARPEPGIKYYSGTATYAKTFDCPVPESGKGRQLWLDLGALRELAQVRLNGKDLGILWTPPFRVEISGAVKPAGNQLEIEVVNFWPNRIIGDDSLPKDQRLTRTNVRKLTSSTALMESGLLGPVQILEAR